MDLLKDLPKAISLNWDNKEWIQQIDYEQLPFWCRICHEYGHFGRNYHRGSQDKKARDQEEAPTNEGFTQLKIGGGVGVMEGIRDVRKDLESLRIFQTLSRSWRNWNRIKRKKKEIHPNPRRPR